MAKKEPPPSPRTYKIAGKEVTYDPACPFPSDQLPALRKFGVPFLGAPIRMLDPVLLLVDANRALATIWTKARYGKVENRTPLEEAVAAGVVLAFAPPALLQEVDDEHLGRYQPSKKKEPIPLSRLQEARRLLLQSIRIVEPPNISSPSIERLRARDPKDVAYAQLFEHLKLDAVLSRDADWEATGYPVVSADDHDLIATLKKYARAATEELGRFNALAVGTALTFEAVKGAWGLFSRAHPAVQLLIGGTLFITAINPETYRTLGEKVLPPFAEYCNQLQAKGQERAQAQRLIERDIQPNPRRLSLKEHARRVLLKAKEPLDLSEIDRRVRAAGANSRSKNLGSYLRRQMMKDKRFIEYADGKWEVREVITWPGMSPAARVNAPFAEGFAQGLRVKPQTSG
jgi:hypothetical protein